MLGAALVPAARAAPLLLRRRMQPVVVVEVAVDVDVDLDCVCVVVWFQMSLGDTLSSLEQ